MTGDELTMNEKYVANDSDSETDFECLFKEKNPEDSVFYFRQINVEFIDEVCEVTYTFNFDNEFDLSCSLIVRNVSHIESVAFKRMILSIGLCALPWYWMGFASKRIVIDESVRQSCSTFSVFISYHIAYSLMYILSYFFLSFSIYFNLFNSFPISSYLILYYPILFYPIQKKKLPAY